VSRGIGRYRMTQEFRPSRSTLRPPRNSGAEDLSDDPSTGAWEIIGVQGPYPSFARVVPGGLTRVVLTIVNRGSEPNLFSVAVEGEAGEWATVQPATVSLPPSDSCQIEIAFRLPSAGSPALGQSWYGVRVAALREPRGSQQGVGCLALENHLVTTSMREARMRPGAWSEAGFLGPDEHLTEVIERDASATKILGVSYEQLADNLERLLTAYEAVKSQANDDFMQAQQDNPAVITYREYMESIARVTDLDPRFAVAQWDYMGRQLCPWGDDDATAIRWAAGEWFIRNLRTGQQMPRPGRSAPGLIIHLIRSHHFFEGFGSRYRVDPTELARLLELGPYAAGDNSDGA
jgi:hypothetical protein